MQPDPAPPPADRNGGDLAAMLRKSFFGSAMLSDVDLRRVAPLISLRYVEKGGALLSPGEICTFEALVVRGCLRTYFVEPEGTERVLSFAPEGWWVSDVESFLSDRPSTLRITALETTELLVLDKANLGLLQSQVPASRPIVRLVAEQTLMMLQRRLIGSMRKSAAQRYVEFRNLYPGLDGRIPQYHIAAYLGISPEFLCKLRRRLPERA
jgi:CRP-like cAMP-binding protein